jgi:tetratricopeptide (TPR) repeat protein
MENAYEQHEKKVEVLNYYGLVLSKGAGEANMFRAAMLSSKAEDILDDALDIDPENVEAHLYRGILKVNVPKFLGKLKDGLKDLKFVINSSGLPNDMYVVANFYMAYGLEKAGSIESAVERYKDVVRYGYESEYYNYSKKKVEELSDTKVEDITIEAVDYEAKGDKFSSEKDYVNAYKMYIKATEKDTTRLDLYMKYLNSMNIIARDGYPDQVYEDVAFMSDLAFNVADAFRHIVRLNPDNEEFRLYKAATLVSLPFFCNCLEEGIQEAEWVAKNGQTRANVKQANEMVKLGKLKQKKKSLTDQYIKLEDEKDKKKLIKQMMTDETSQKEPQGISSKINLALGFGDYIAPQTAVWVEDMKGNYVATVYVSGFSAKVKEKQAHLPKWAKSSEFEGNIVKVTAASIDSGNHTFYWNNTDSQGKLLTSGDYMVCAEVSHWPHVGYSQQKVKLSLGGKSYNQKIKGDNIIAGLKVSY